MNRNQTSMIESDRPSASADTDEAGTPAHPSPEEMAQLAARMGDERKAADIRVLDVSATSSEIADYFVIMTGFNRRQIQAVAWELDREMKARGVNKLGMEGYETAWWVLVDYGSVVVHVFHADAREYYDLDMLQGDATRMDWHNLTARHPEASTDDPDGESGESGDEDEMSPPDEGPVTADYEPVERPETMTDQEYQASIEKLAAEAGFDPDGDTGANGEPDGDGNGDDESRS